MKNLLTIFAAFLFFSIGLSAQNTIVLTGQIVDEITKEPIAYAHVGIPEQGIGTTSGHDGKFKFKVPRRYANSDMMVSFMGYKTYKQAVNTVTVPARISLIRAQNELPEILVTDGDWALNIIREAVKAIPKNYPKHSTRHLAFYRESRTDKNSQYIYLAEGVLNIYKKSYKSKKEGQVSLVEGRRINLLNPLDTMISRGLNSGHMAAHRFDFVYNREDFLQEKYFPCYKYWLESMTTYNGKSVYVIAFDKDEEAPPVTTKSRIGKEKSTYENGFNVFRIGPKKKRSLHARMRGRVYIDKETFAIIRGDFEITKEGLKKYDDYPLYAGSWKANSYKVNYRQIGDRWYFSDAFRKGHYGSGGIYSNEVKMTEINSEKGKPILYAERLHRNQRFSRMTGTYDPNFWAEYNTTPLSAGQAEGIRQMENAKEAQLAFAPENMEALQRQRDSIRYVKQLQIESLEGKEIESGKENKNEKAKLKGPDFEDGLISFLGEDRLGDITPSRRKKGPRSWVKFSLGAGTHFIQSAADPINIIYESGEDEIIFSIEDDIKKRNFEIVSNLDIDIFLNRRFFIRAGMAWDYYNSIYKDRTIGVGAEWNLSKQRPVYFKAIAQYEKLRYARKVGAVDNDYGKFKIDGKKINSKSFNVYYGSRTRNIKLAGELSVELMPDREIYIRGAYHLPLGTRNEIWVKERRQVFRKKNSQAVSDSEISVMQDGERFSSDIPDRGSFSVTVGLLFK